MSGPFRMDDYVDVAQRIHDFYERFPEGSLQSADTPFVLEIGGKPFVVYHALAFRTPDDPVPAHGWAWEPVPGPTQFTRDSELMNAETAAWGRAIVACGFSTKKIASAQEVRSRQGSSPDGVARQGAAGHAQGPAAPALTDEPFVWPSGKHQGKTFADTPPDYLDWYLGNGPRAEVRAAIELYRSEHYAMAGSAVDPDDIPF